jgi:histidyl-tRNA synthetase
MSKTLQAIRGMNDILPEQAPLWQHFEHIVRGWLHAYGYREIRMPLVEPTGLFKRAIGEVTDIVEKEMYTWTDALNGESLSLRPEGTASCVRAALEHNLFFGNPQRLFYSGPMFRHERPQKGRYRQFHQVGIESLGYAGPDMDVEHILMGARLWKLLGIGGIALQLNTLGTSEDRARHRARLIHYLESHQDLLDEEAKRRLHSNPLRILDSRNPALQETIAAAPKLLDDLDEVSLRHFESVQALLRVAGVSFSINPRLVRGLDYYNYTVYEWVTDQLGSQGTVCAGGRYDGLVEQLGGKRTPACGFAMGVERLLALMEAQGSVPARPVPDIYLAHMGEQAQHLALTAAEQLRDAGLQLVLHCGGGSFKSQMKKADASGARYAVIIGDDEAAAGLVSLKPLREQAEQVTVPVDQVAALVRHSND